jgi:hypothetical protein
MTVCEHKEIPKCFTGFTFMKKEKKIIHLLNWNSNVTGVRTIFSIKEYVTLLGYLKFLGLPS